MTAKDTKSSDDTQAALPFGALPDSASSDGAASPKPKRAKKAASKKAASKKTSTKKAASKKAASSKSVVAADAEDAAPKPRARKAKVAEEGAADVGAPKRKTKKKVVRKSSRSAVAEAESSEPVVTSGDDAPVKRKRTARTKTERSESDDSIEAVVTFAPRGGSGRGASAVDRDDAGSGGGEFVSRGSYSSDSPSESGAGINGPDVGGPDASGPDASGDGDGGDDGKGRKRKARRGRRRRRGGDSDGEAPAGESAGSGGDEGAHVSQRDGHGKPGDGNPAGGNPGGGGSPRDGSDEEGGSRRSRRRRRRRRRGGERDGEEGGGADDNPSDQNGGHKSSQKSFHKGSQKGTKRDTPSGEGHRKGGKGSRGDRDGAEGGKGSQLASGMFILEKGQVSVLRLEKNQWMSSKEDIYVPKKLVQQFKLRDGMIVTGPTSKGYKHKVQLDGVQEIDDHPPQFWKNKPTFKNLTSIDPDFHYAVGDITDDVSMRVMDLIAPVGRGQRGLLVAPPRSGKTTLMRQFADGLEKGYPDVHLMVLLIDERPEEATEWTRSVTNGTVFVSTADESAKNHINLAELVWRRAMRLVEMGEDVVLLLDSITRLARAYNNQSGSGRTMSGGLDSGAMERPRKIFGSARNTVEAGSLTILGTTLVETGSRMDQMVFEEFKGTGNMELVLNRKLADRRIFPAIDLEKSGTRKEEKLVGMRRLKQIHTLRRVISRMHFAEAADLLITRLSDVEKTDEFLERFTVDPEA